MARAYFDIDGILYNFPEGLRQFLCEQMGFRRENLPEPTCWDFFSEDWRLSKEEYVQIYNGNPGFLFSRGGLMKVDNLRALWALYEAGHEIAFVTSRYLPHRTDARTTQRRKSRAEYYTKQWLRASSVPSHQLFVVGPGEKEDIISTADVYVDDYWENLKTAPNSTTRLFLYERPYNEHEQENYPTINSLWPLVGICDGIDLLRKSQEQIKVDQATSTDLSNQTAAST